MTVANELRPLWRKIFSFNWKFGLFLILCICVPRFILVLQANASGNYASIGLIMVVSALAPFIFLNKYGRKKIGLTRPARYRWLPVAFIAGMAASLVLYFIGQYLYGSSYQNWYEYIGKSYNIPADITDKGRDTLFMIMASTAMIFSPIGEELFFRGIVHASFAESIGEKSASLADATAFALTHLSHFGLVFIAGQWQFYSMPAIIWVFAMFFVSLLFYQARKYTGSIAGAIVCHSAFNLGMVYSIFYWLR
jgi:membrane protease YdiL (CAAX protease family)